MFEENEILRKKLAAYSGGIHIYDMTEHGSTVTIRKEDFFIYPNVSKREKKWQVPKTIHFIWIGVDDKPMPDKYIENIESFSTHSDYKRILWTDSSFSSDANVTFEVREYESLNLKVFPKNISNSSLSSPSHVGVLSDILRFEVVYLFGGIYADTDCTNQLGLPPLLTRSFVEYSLDWNNLSSSVFGFPKKSNFIKLLLQAISLNIEREEVRQQPVYMWAGPIFFTAMFVHYNDSSILMIDSMYLSEKTDTAMIYQSIDGSWQK